MFVCECRKIVFREWLETGVGQLVHPIAHDTLLGQNVFVWSIFPDI
jgi:hypothetical protein